MSMEHWVEYNIPKGSRSFNAIAMLTDDNRGYMHGYRASGTWRFDEPSTPPTIVAH
jgi:phosphatidylethanolamine-binding protein (PEBP) family uncharacterized protein